MGKGNRGWTGEPRRHELAGKGIKTNIDKTRRFDVSNFVARGKLEDIKKIEADLKKAELGSAGGWRIWIGEEGQVSPGEILFQDIGGSQLHGAINFYYGADNFTRADEELTKILDRYGYWYEPINAEVFGIYSKEDL